MSSPDGNSDKADLILYLGGTRSGKSQKAFERARAKRGGVTFLATARPCDPEMERRIEQHQSERPEHWRTIEPDYDFLEVSRGLAREEGVVLFDEVSLLVASWLEDNLGKDEIVERVEQFVRYCEDGRGDWVLVSALVGQSPVPVESSARRFRDLMGRVNQKLAEAANEVHEVKAGLLNTLKVTV